MRHQSCFVVILGLAVMAACGSPSENTAREPAPATPPPGPSASSAYPALYRELALPEIDGGTVANTGRQQTSLRDGLDITVKSTMSVDQARTYYQERLAAAGWTARPGGRGATMPNMPVAIMEFSKTTMTYSVAITAQPDGGIQIRIGVKEN